MEDKKWIKMCKCTTSGNCPEYSIMPDGGIEIHDLDQHDKSIVLNKEQIEGFVASMLMSK